MTATVCVCSRSGWSADASCGRKPPSGTVSSDAGAVIDVAGRHRLAAAGADVGAADVGVTVQKILSTTFFARGADEERARSCDTPRMSAVTALPDLNAASGRGAARADPGATRAVSFRRRQAHHHPRAVTLARAGDRASEAAAGQAAPDAVWAEVGEATAADRAVGAAAGGVWNPTAASKNASEPAAADQPVATA
jgi:hypothetical protein